jgi:hypothetical protein
VVACSNTKSSSVSRGWRMTAFLPRAFSVFCCSATAWACCSFARLSSSARSAAVPVGIASNWAAVASSLARILPTSRDLIACNSRNMASISSMAVFAARRTSGYGRVSLRFSHWPSAIDSMPIGFSSFAYTS